MPGSRIPSFRPIQGKCKHYTLLWPVESIPMVLHWSGSRTESREGIKERWHDWETKRIIAAEWCKRQWEDGGVQWSKWCHQNFKGILESWRITLTHSFPMCNRTQHLSFKPSIMFKGPISHTLSDLHLPATYYTAYLAFLFFQTLLRWGVPTGWNKRNQSPWWGHKGWFPKSNVFQCIFCVIEASEQCFNFYSFRSLLTNKILINYM